MKCTPASWFKTKRKGVLGALIGTLCCVSPYGRRLRRTQIDEYHAISLHLTIIALDVLNDNEVNDHRKELNKRARPRGCRLCKMQVDGVLDGSQQDAGR